MHQVFVFVDRKRARGGGQVVLENLLRVRTTDDPVHVITSRQGIDLLKLDSGVKRHLRIDDALTAATSGVDVSVIVNATSDFLLGLRIVSRLRRTSRSVSAIAVLHNYPTGFMRSVLTKLALRAYDWCVAVEPGLFRLRADTLIPPWLSVDTPVDLDTRVIPRAGTVKCFARPDYSKGLDLLPQIFGELSAKGVRCEVALGHPLDNRPNYVRKLRRDLAPWLVDGARGPDWLAPGDIFLIPSRSGEAACLSAQEAMAKGAAVVASRIGLMPYLMPSGGAFATFPVGQSHVAVAEVESLVSMTPDAFAEGCKNNSAAISARAGRWYAWVARELGLTA